ncbi:MAG: PDZ domain-containing protein [Opitutus sp.]|nr:PDZ domain-containing protein [Opitutus sp.]
MKTSLQKFVSVVTLVAAVQPALPAAENTPAAKAEKREFRVLAAPDRAHRIIVQSGEKQKIEKETVTFLGVETASVSATTSAQLGLPRGTGLVVNHIVPNSPATGALNVHDILLKLDDQILIETRQLSVLIRNHQEGDEITLTYLRGGQKATARVKLGKQEVPKIAALERLPLGASAFGFNSAGDGRFEMRVPGPDGVEGREGWDRVLSLLQRARPAPDGPPGFVPPGARIRIDHAAGTGLQAMRINVGNSNLEFNDDEGSLELTIKEGAKSLVARGPKGEPIFSGAVTTPEERQAMPTGVRQRLEQLEGMHDITFRTDSDFNGAATKVIRPRGIALPLPREVRRSAPPSLFY